MMKLIMSKNKINISIIVAIIASIVFGYLIIQNGYFESKREPFLKIELTDLSNTYKVGETVSFTIIESGYGGQCTAPHIVIINENKEVFWEYRQIKKCPSFTENQPILNIVKIPPKNSNLTQFIKPGKYLINVDSERAHVSKEITVLS